ncbi:rRNA-processing protein EBP2 [Elysia marginata]|uniref:rRNA-processing protein EBP2 n=1 Tax=Elysia marginata TaxID=1093978 RepID=A0AAV4ECT7_9GAST|nr:rRNA-processing protein EBP2 [Elysia marginata]
MKNSIAINTFMESDSDEEIQEALAAGTIKPGLVVEEQKKDFINNREGMKQKVKEFSLSNLRWIERLDLISKPVPVSATIGQESNHQDNDDFNREMRFYQQAQTSVLLGLKKLAELSVPTKRPEDYFAEMAKSDNHMKKVRSKLLEKKMSLERSEKVKKMRELRKYGKKVQQEVLQQRQKEKKAMLDSVKKFRKGVFVLVSHGWRNSPGIRRVVPYTSSAGEQSGSTLQDERMPNRTIGSSSNQSGPVVRALRAALSCRWRRSTIPLACGW